MTSRGLFQRCPCRFSFPAKVPSALFSISIFFSLVLQLMGLPQETEIPDSKSAEWLMLHRAVWFMPASLQRILEKHSQELDSGLNPQSFDTSGWAIERHPLEVNLRQKVLTIGNLLRSRPRFGEVAREMGNAARLIIYLNMPEGEGLSSSDLDFLLRYIHKNSPKFPLVVYDDPGQGISSMEDFLCGLDKRRLQLSKQLHEAYPSGMVISSLEIYDFRSPVFGISSLVYSHSINDIARLWISSWKAANGDMSGRPIMN